MTLKHTTKSLGRSAIWSILNQSVGQVLSLAVFLVTARFVSKEAFGIMAGCLLVIEFFRQCLMESVSTLFYSKKDPTTEDYNAGFFLILLAGGASALIVFLSSDLLAGFFGNREFSGALKWVSALLLTVGLSKMHEIWLGKNFQFRTLAIRSICSIFIGGACGIMMAMHGFGIESLIAQQIVTAIVSSAWLWFGCPWRPTLKFGIANVAEIIKYGKYFSLNSMAAFFCGQSDVLLSSHYLGPAATGIYNAAKRLLSAIGLIVGTGLNTVALPALTTFSHDRDELAKSYLTCTKLTALFSAPMYAGLAVLSVDLIRFLMGEKWIEAAPIFAILTLIGFVGGLNQYSWNILLIQRKVRKHSVLIFSEALLNLLLLVIFAKYGLIYLAIAFVAKTVLFSPLITRSALSLLGLKHWLYFKVTLMPIVLSLVMAGMLFCLRQNLEFPAIVNIMIMVPAGVFIYLTLLWLFDKPSLHQCIDIIRQTLSRHPAPSLQE